MYTKRQVIEAVILIGLIISIPVFAEYQTDNMEDVEKKIMEGVKKNVAESEKRTDFKFETVNAKLDGIQKQLVNMQRLTLGFTSILVVVILYMIRRVEIRVDSMSNRIETRIEKIDDRIYETLKGNSD